MMVESPALPAAATRGGGSRPFWVLGERVSSQPEVIQGHLVGRQSMLWGGGRAPAAAVRDRSLPLLYADLAARRV